MSRQAAPPTVLPIPGPRGHYRHGLGLAVFLNSRGDVTAYRASGYQAWQVATLQPCTVLLWSSAGLTDVVGMNCSTVPVPSNGCGPIGSDAIRCLVAASWVRLCLLPPVLSGHVTGQRQIIGESHGLSRDDERVSLKDTMQASLHGWGGSQTGQLNTAAQMSGNAGRLHILVSCWRKGEHFPDTVERGQALQSARAREHIACCVSPGQDIGEHMQAEPMRAPHEVCMWW